MRLDILCFLTLGFFIYATDATIKDKNVHIKIQVPELLHKHSHQHTIYKKSPKSYEDESDGDRNAHIIIHHHQYNPEDGYNDEQKYTYNPEKKYKPKKKKAGKKKKSQKQKRKKYGDDKDFKQILENYDAKPEKNDGLGNDGGFKTSVHTEHYEVKKINPNARFPDEKYIIQGAYKVQETDPWGNPITEFHKYDSPISKIAASILSKYDYTNFRPGESDGFEKEKEDNHDHENIEFGHDDSYEHYDNKKKKSQGYTKPNKPQDNHDFSFDFDSYGNQKKSQEYTIPVVKTYTTSKKSNNERDYENTARYKDISNIKPVHYTAPINYGPVQSSREDLHSKQVNNKKDNTYRYISPVETVKKSPEENEYDHGIIERELEYEFQKEFGHLVDPGHSAEVNHPHSHYDDDWEKDLIEHIYGASSNAYVQKLEPRFLRRV